jgi:hypothetical protein
VSGIACDGGLSNGDNFSQDQSDLKAHSAAKSKDPSRYQWYESERAFEGDFYHASENRYIKLQFTKLIGWSEEKGELLIHSFGFRDGEVKMYDHVICDQVKSYRLPLETIPTKVVFNPKSGALLFRLPESSECSSDYNWRDRSIELQNQTYSIIYESTGNSGIHRDYLSRIRQYPLRVGN